MKRVGGLCSASSGVSVEGEEVGWRVIMIIPTHNRTPMACQASTVLLYLSSVIKSVVMFPFTKEVAEISLGISYLMLCTQKLSGLRLSQWLWARESGAHFL